MKIKRYKTIEKIINEIKNIIYSIGYVLLIESRNKYDDHQI